MEKISISEVHKQTQTIAGDKNTPGSAASFGAQLTAYVKALKDIEGALQKVESKEHERHKDELEKIKEGDQKIQIEKGEDNIQDEKEKGGEQKPAEKNKEERIGYRDEEGDLLQFADENGELIEYQNNERFQGEGVHNGVVTELKYQPGLPGTGKGDVRNQEGFGSDDMPMALVYQLQALAEQDKVKNNLPKENADGSGKKGADGKAMKAIPFD